MIYPNGHTSPPQTSDISDRNAIHLVYFDSNREGKASFNLVSEFTLTHQPRSKPSRGPSGGTCVPRCSG